MKKVKPGSIILFHNAAKHTPGALPQLIYKDYYTIDVAGKQHSNAATSAWQSSDITPVKPEYEPE